MRSLYMSLMCLAVVQGTPAQTPADAGAAAQASRSNFEAHYQATYVWQHKAAFNAAYSGPNSLSTEAEKSYTFSATAFFGARLGSSTEVYLNPELIQGVPLSGLTGLGSPTNGEIQKVAGPKPKLYLPRLFVRQTWALSGDAEPVDSAPNQLGGSTRSTHRLVLNAGKLGITDVFDANAYSHDARSQFLTWASVAHGAYDFAADAQGYTLGASLEYDYGAWAVRAGRFAGPKQSNGEVISLAIGPYHGDQLEVEHSHELAGQPGVIRALLWNNREHMGRFQDALDFAQPGGGTPDVANMRRANHKHGWGLHWEQALNRDVGVFVRRSWADGQTETYSFEEVERSDQVGVVLKGPPWERRDDTLGLLLIRNGLSGVHQQYLARGGLGFFIGDGRLTYRQEQVFETYYSAKLSRGVWMSADFQRITNPAYNADRGPVDVYGLRAHVEF